MAAQELQEFVTGVFGVFFSEFSLFFCPQGVSEVEVYIRSIRAVPPLLRFVCVEVVGWFVAVDL